MAGRTGRARPRERLALKIHHRECLAVLSMVHLRTSSEFIMTKPGLYVEGRAYGMKVSQAIARANHLAQEYRRTVVITLVDVWGHAKPFGKAKPEKVAA